MIYMAVLIIILSAIYLWHYFCTDYQHLITTVTRSQLFQIRGRLFDSAMNGKLSFNCKAYGMTRKTLNGLISDCDNLRLSSIVISIMIHKAMNKNFNKIQEKHKRDMEHAIRGLSREGKKIINEIHFSMHLAVIMCVIESSIILLPLFYIIKSVLRFSVGANNLSKATVSLFQKHLISVDTCAKVFR